MGGHGLPCIQNTSYMFQGGCSKDSRGVNTPFYTPPNVRMLHSTSSSCNNSRGNDWDPGCAGERTPSLDLQSWKITPRADVIEA